MNNFIFQNSTKVFFGQGCVREYLACLIKGADTVLLAYGGGSIKSNGVYDEVTAILQRAGKRVLEFSGIMPNPTYRFKLHNKWRLPEIKFVAYNGYKKRGGENYEKKGAGTFRPSGVADRIRLYESGLRLRCT